MQESTTTPFVGRIAAVLAEGHATVERVRRLLVEWARRNHPAAGDDPLPALLVEASARVELSTGYRYLFENVPGLVGRIAAAVEYERQSGRFLRFQIAVQPHSGPISLEVSGPGARTFLTPLDVPDHDRAQDFARRLADERRHAWLTHAG